MSVCACVDTLSNDRVTRSSTLVCLGLPLACRPSLPAAPSFDGGHAFTAPVHLQVPGAPLPSGDGARTPITLSQPSAVASPAALAALEGAFNSY